MNFSRRSSLALLAAVALVAAVPAVAPAQPNPLGLIKPLFTYQKTVIAVPTMTQAPAGAEVITQVIRRDLELTGVFQMPKDARAINQLRLNDAQRGSIDFASWSSSGAEHLLVTEVLAVSGGRIKVLVQLFDIASGQAIINRNIEGPDADLRRLAHRISDEVVAMTKPFDGFAQTQILFTNEAQANVREVAVMDADGFNARTLTRDNSLINNPVWGNNGSEIYFSSYAGNLARIYGVQIASGTRWTIAGYGGTNSLPAWNQATGRVVMALAKDGNTEIYTSARDGSALTRVTKSPDPEGSPAWSPDGSQIAYVSNAAGKPQIYITSAQGGGARKLPIPGPWADAPDWSRDGKRIAFVSRIEGRSDIFIMNADGSGQPTRLTQGQGDNESPTWAPNSVHLTFASNRSGKWQVYLMLDDGSNQTALTSSGNNRQPDWGPAPRE